MDSGEHQEFHVPPRGEGQQPRKRSHETERISCGWSSQTGFTPISPRTDALPEDISDISWNGRIMFPQWRSQPEPLRSKLRLRKGVTSFAPKRSSIPPSNEALPGKPTLRPGFCLFVCLKGLSSSLVRRWSGSKRT